MRNDKADVPVSAETIVDHRFWSYVVAGLAGLFSVVTSLTVAHGALGVAGAGLALVMLTIAIIDARYLLIPDALNVAGLVLGLVNAMVVAQGDLSALLIALLRAIIVAGAFLAVRLAYARLRGRHGLGLGDVKLAAVAGAWLDWSILPIAIEIAALSALATYALRYLLLRQRLRLTSRMPFGLFFAPAIWVGWLLQMTLPGAW
ncbi:prepilin peptidase [Bradyrhizobium manausense]|uniref:prepilin peptidase n=1 Tax=Bradyrhizobium manausense TaxID=989370 RepID=UPI001BA9C353|nr:A24 family peptidase [Bradyrhizobium manausense]MBR1089216.1 prepilin peptidase [Bradyrhizobium manausense]